ncbi:SDR family NAD(P)-dependent oxidoreductase [Arenimonas terrae]|uniref:SDR family NAD(P)-dependent oxidoreductase n=1 Tax=Arenimonas terrae TaxID=2546226 RepID=A0A5C4RRQ6_9GAMM|nr:SDR family NAD(P)-dependent oxidoreductase [Arenimonas terrae]TNJ33728.1 SDR family NAD(P)-dependent oxidoreductase [Arenimonas terrae]
MKSILITGTSSGYGLATARHFLAQGWRVVATMRTPKPGLFPASPNLQLLPLDVTDLGSIQAALDAAGDLDAIVNNAGIGVVGAFEATPMATVDEVFATNTFGTMAVCQAAIPRLRARGGGVLVNVTSSVTLARMPLAAAYSASKAAVDAFTASLAFELEPFGIRSKLVLPGYGPTTAFAANGGDRMQGLVPPAYAAFAEKVFAGFANVTLTTRESDVAEAVWRAVQDTTGQLRFPAGADAVALAQAR